MRHLVPVQARTLLVLLAAILPWLGRARAAHTQASLVVSAERARPGDTVMAGVVLRMDKRWHTYWKNSGASGMPTKIEWHLPPGVQAGETQWPLPEVLTESDLTTYIYRDTAVLITPLRLAPELKPGPLKLGADVSWLECDVQCVPGDATVAAKLEVAADTKPSANATLLEEWTAKLPKPGAAMAARAHWDGSPKGETRTLVLEWTAARTVTNAVFLPYSSEEFEVQPSQKLGAEPGTVRLAQQVRKLSGEWPKQISGVIVQEAAGKREGYEVVLRATSAQNGSAQAPGPGTGGITPGPGLGRMLLYAFLGGLILNVMPCVLPVIALKILGFVGQARNEPREARKLGLVYGSGVVLSFLVLAGLVVAAKAAGQQAGWGFQFANPYFLVVMTTLVTLIALNLFGVFEVSLGGRALDTAARLTSGHGVAGAFFNGLLATVLATSCTAPFLGAAIGFAFAQPPLIVLLTLGTVGLGLAAPYVVLSWQPGWLKFLPRPGPWMERFKVAVGFPMLAAAVWLFSLASLHYGERAWWLAIFLVLVAVAAWIYGEFVQRNRNRPGVALAAILAVLAAGYFLTLEGQLQWRQPVGQSGPSASPGNSPRGISWQPWSRAAVENARAEGRPVLVDFTAKWCLTCNTIVKPALESASVREKLRAVNAAAFLGDYTSLPKDITEELQRYGRAGVPLVLVFPRDPARDAIVLPEAITPGMVIRALEQSVGPNRES